MEDGAMTELREAVHIDGDGVISFRGCGSARFRIQHTRDDHGQPDELSWCDCSAMSDASIEPQAAINKDGGVALLVDAIDGDRDIRYRRFKGDWLRVLPSDDEDEDACKRCEAYAIAIRPA
jgi:hypothetical protein